MGSTATIAQANGLKLGLASDQERPGVAIVTLTGADFSARMTEGIRPSMPEELSLREFISTAVHVLPGQDKEWRSEAQDLTLQVETYPDGRVLLRVGMAATSDDATDWFVWGTLEVSRDDLRQFAREIGQAFDIPAQD